MEYIFARTKEVQQLVMKLASESEALQKNIKSLHTPTLMRSLKRKIQMIIRIESKHSNPGVRNLD